MSIIIGKGTSHKTDEEKESDLTILINLDRKSVV